MVYVLLDQPTEDSVEMAVNFIKEIGAFISDTTPALITECAAAVHPCSGCQGTACC